VDRNEFSVVGVEDLKIEKLNDLKILSCSRRLVPKFRDSDFLLSKNIRAFVANRYQPFLV